MAKEPPLMQKLGRKKYMQQIEKCNKFYDDHMAGKRNRKTGEYYNEVHYTDPSKPKYNIGGGASIGYVPCKTEECDEYLSLKRTTRAKICSKCGKMNDWSREEVEEIEEYFKSLKDGQ